MSISCGARDSCPDAPDITINNTNLTLDGTTANFRDEYFQGPASTSTLAYLPYQNASVQIDRGGAVQRQGVDFTLDNTGQVITWAVPLVAGEEAHVSYFSVGNVAAVSAPQVGDQKPWAGSTAPAGWVLMDGATSLSRTTYASLFAFANPNGLVLSSTATTFILKELKMEIRDVASATTTLFNVVIKY